MSWIFYLSAFLGGAGLAVAVPTVNDRLGRALRGIGRSDPDPTPSRPATIPGAPLDWPSQAIQLQIEARPAESRPDPTSLPLHASTLDVTRLALGELAFEDVNTVCEYLLAQVWPAGFNPHSSLRLEYLERLRREMRSALALLDGFAVEADANPTSEFAAVDGGLGALRAAHRARMRELAGFDGEFDGEFDGGFDGEAAAADIHPDATTVQLAEVR